MLNLMGVVLWWFLRDYCKCRCVVDDDSHEFQYSGPDLTYSIVFSFMSGGNSRCQMNRSLMLKPPAWYRHASPNELAKASLGTICAMGDSQQIELSSRKSAKSDSSDLIVFTIGN